MAENIMSHFTWSIECPRGECPFCHGPTVLVCHKQRWEAHEESVNKAFGPDAYDQEFCDGIETDEELTAHYCKQCQKLTSVSLNTR